MFSLPKISNAVSSKGYCFKLICVCVCVCIVELELSSSVNNGLFTIGSKEQQENVKKRLAPPSCQWKIKYAYGILPY